MSARISEPAQPRRAVDQAQISISLPKELLDRVDEAARRENRNRSNFIATALYNVIDSLPASDGAETRRKKKKK